MANIFNMFSPKKMVGVDIGTSSVKVVEISGRGEQKTLENYGEITSASLYKEPLHNLEKGSYLLSSDSAVHAIRSILDEAKIKTKEAIFSIPDFSTFYTSFDIPSMPEKEISGAVRYNASQYIPMSISEVSLDWRVMPNANGDKNSSLKVTLVAVPNQVVQEYQVIAKKAGLKLHALEAEAFGITRSLIKNNQKAVCLIDIGVQSSAINIVDNGFLRKSYSFIFNTNQLLLAVSSALKVSREVAENIKNNEGLMHSNQDMVKNLYLLIDPLLLEVKNVCAEFFQSEKKEIEEIYLTGGSANLPGLKEYFAEILKKNTYVPNCFSGFLYPHILEETLKNMSPGFSVAIGAALEGLKM